MPNPHFILYHTDGCHLCELAAVLLKQANVTFMMQDICDSSALAARYGTCIPVLASANGRELNWPFDLHDVQHFVATEELTGDEFESGSN